MWNKASKAQRKEVIAVAKWRDAHKVVEAGKCVVCVCTTVAAVSS
jgi:hypothetical protein